MKDNKVFCNRCAHCHKDDTEEVIKINLHKLFIIKSNTDNNIPYWPQSLLILKLL